MAEIKHKSKTTISPHVFSKRLDFYWKFVALYSFVLIAYGLFKGSIDEGTFTIKVLDPIVLLLLLFIVVTTLWLAVESYKDKKIIVGSDFIIFKNRFREKKYTTGEIVKIFFSKEKPTSAYNSFRIIKMKVNNRRRLIRIKPSSFYMEASLINNLLKLKRNLKK